MAEKSLIAWTDATWNAVIGCSHVSPGCEHCYAETLSHRYYAAMIAQGRSAESIQKAGWTNLPWGAQNAPTNVILKPHRLCEPLKWKEPKRVFVNSLSDVFHEQVPDTYVDQMFAVMAACPDHTFQILTKRPERMRSYLNADDRPQRIANASHTVTVHTRKLSATVAQLTPIDRPWPLPNVWIGVSAEDQRRWDERIPILQNTRGAVRFVSAEPLLGPIDPGDHWAQATYGPGVRFDDWRAPIDWIIVGGESGPNYRPMSLDYARYLRDRSVRDGVAFFYKQSSGFRSGMNPTLDGVEWHQYPVVAART